MNLKYTILNVSYEQPPKLKQLQTKFRRTITRYSDYTRKNKINQSKKEQELQNDQLYTNQNKKFSLYQQYKSREYLRKLKINGVKADQPLHKDIIIKSSIKDQTIMNSQRNLNMTQSFGFQTVHSQFKPQTPNLRRRFSISLNSSQPIRYEGEQRSRRMGVMGVRTSFLDKYKLRNSNEMEQSLNQEQKDRRVKRRQILCSTKRNKSLEPRSLRTSEMKRHKHEHDGGNNFLSIYSHDRIMCRPWSPSKEEEFEKL